MSSWFCCWKNEDSNETQDYSEENENLNKGESQLETDKFVTNQPSRNDLKNENRTFLCFADKIRDDQVDCCPKYWFREFKSNSKITCQQRVQAVIWRLCFLVTCLPMCYPCYLSRTIRRRKKHVKLGHYFEKPVDIQNDLNKTIERQVTRKSCKSGGRSNSSPEQNSNVINVNVIRLHSPASRVLNQYFQASEQSNNTLVHPKDEEEKEEVFLREASSNGSHIEPKIQQLTRVQRKSNATSMLKPPLSPHVNPHFSTSLGAVPEDEAVITTFNVNDELDGLANEVEEDGVKLRRRSNAFHRKSSIVMRLHGLRRSSMKSKPIVEENEEITLRRRGRGGGQYQTRRKSSRKLSIVSGGSIYYSFDSEDEDETAFSKDMFSTSHEMVTLGKRPVLIRDLDCQVILNFFDEANVADWKGRDLRQANRIPNIDVLLLVIRKDNFEELKHVLRLETGILGYINKYWRGFFPILIVELYNDEEEEDREDLINGIHKSPSEEYDKMMQHQLTPLFGNIHRIRMTESELLEEWLLETLARLFLHTRIYQCSRFFGADVIKTMHLRCPGGCGLRKSKLISAKRLRKKGKKKRSKQKPITTPSSNDHPI